MKKKEKIVAGAIAGIVAGAALGLLVYLLQKGKLSCSSKAEKNRKAES